MVVFDELSALIFGGVDGSELNGTARLPERTPYEAPTPAPEAPAPLEPRPAGEHFIGELRLIRYRPLFSGPFVERVDELAVPAPAGRARALGGRCRAAHDRDRRHRLRPLERHLGRAPRARQPQARRGRRARPRRARRRPPPARRGREVVSLRPPALVRRERLAVVDLRDRGVHHHQPRPRLLRVPDARRAQGDGADAAALRPEPRRPLRAPAADRRPRQADPQGELLPGRRDRRALHLRAVPGRVHGALHVLGDPVGAGLGDRRLPDQRLRRRPPDRAAPDLRDRLARHLRLHPRRLGVRLEVRAPRLDAHLRPARLLRGLARAQRARRDPDGALALARRHRRRRRPTRPGTSRRSSSASSSS